MRLARFQIPPRVSAAAAMVALVAGGSLGAQALPTTMLRIESVPAAAQVELIGGQAGITPLVVNERDIYPNNYPDARAQLYGTVTLHHPGCEPLRHRVTRSDINQGLHLRLECARDSDGTGTATARPVVAPGLFPSAPSSTLAPPTPRETIPQRRLRQLQVLQELLDEDLLTPAEEQRLRRRILQLNAQAAD